MGGLSGSNACTLIAVLTGLHFLEDTLPIPKQLQDLHLVIPLSVNLMMKGNQGCLPFTKTIRLEISGINSKHLNATLRERESQKSLSTSARET